MCLKQQQQQQKNNTLTEWKISLKMSENHSKVSKNHSKKSENHSKRVNFTFLGMSLGDSPFFSLSVSSPKSKITLLKWFSLVLRVIFTRLEWFFTLFTLLKSNHFTLFTLTLINRAYVWWKTNALTVGYNVLRKTGLTCWTSYVAKTNGHNNWG